MAAPQKKTLSDVECEVLRHLATAGPQDLTDLAPRWWGSADEDIAAAQLVLEGLAADGLVHAQHLYPAQMLWKRIDPKSAEGRRAGARSFYKLTRDGKRQAGRRR